MSFKYPHSQKLQGMKSGDPGAHVVKKKISADHMCIYKCQPQQLLDWDMSWGSILQKWDFLQAASLLESRNYATL